jgi:hypothetical protein
LSFWPAITAASTSAIVAAMVCAGLAPSAIWPVPAQADSMAIQTRLGMMLWNFIWLSLGEIKRHYW